MVNQTGNKIFRVDRFHQRDMADLVKVYARLNGPVGRRHHDVSEVSDWPQKLRRGTVVLSYRDKEIGSGVQVGELVHVGMPGTDGFWPGVYNRDKSSCEPMTVGSLYLIGSILKLDKKDGLSVCTPRDVEHLRPAYAECRNGFIEVKLPDVTQEAGKPMNNRDFEPEFLPRFAARRLIEGIVYAPISGFGTLRPYDSMLFHD